MTESLADFRGRVLASAEASGKIVKLTGPHSVSQPHCHERTCLDCYPPVSGVVSVHLMVTLPVVDGPELEAWPSGKPHVPVEVAWKAGFHHGRVWPVTVMATSDGMTTHYDAGDIPGWVPRPPDGWDASLAVIA